jgi:hypothetical protein
MKAILTLIIISLLITSCGSSRIAEDNDKLKALLLNMPAYKKELATQVRAHPEDFKYIFMGYTTHDNHEYITICLKRKGLEDTQDILVTNWAKIEGLKRHKGRGYQNAELSGLKLNVINADTDPLFVYSGLDKIVD